MEDNNSNGNEESSVSTESQSDMGRYMELQAAEERVHNEKVDQENQLLAGKYKTVDDLEAGYNNQQQLIGKKAFRIRRRSGYL